MSASAQLQRLEHWRDAGWLRHLDLAFARFVAETDPAAPASLLLAAALLAHLEGRGHCALPLAGLHRDPQALLAWPVDAVESLTAAFQDWPADVAAQQAQWGNLPSLTWMPLADPGGSMPGDEASSPSLDASESAPLPSHAGTSPLVACGGLLYLRRYWGHETRVAAQVRQRAGIAPDTIDLPTAQTLLHRLFPPGAAGSAPDWQKVACAIALRGRLTLITGGPGTGKTHTAARLLMLMQALQGDRPPLRVALAAPTGKAAARLRQSITGALERIDAPLAASLGLGRWIGTLGPARTLHALLGAQAGTRRLRHDAANPLDLDLLVVDEASMIHLEMMAQLLDALPAQARLVLLGDKDQLASVEAGAVMGDLCMGSGDGERGGGYRAHTADWVCQLTGEHLPASTLGDGSTLAQQTVVLRHSHRFDGPIGQLALAVNAGDAATAQAVLAGDADGPVAQIRVESPEAVVSMALGGRAGAVGGYRAYLSRLAQRPAPGDPSGFEAWARSVLAAFDGFRVLCALREGPWGVSGLNAAIERGLVEAGLLARRGEWYEGRPVMVTRNDPALGVSNGDIGIVLRAAGSDGAMRCFFPEGEGLRSVSVGRLADVETAFAMTVHKSQGSEFGHVALVLPDDDAPVLTRELVYTGITRARQAFTLVAPRPELLAIACARLTRRVSGLPGRL